MNVYEVHIENWAIRVKATSFHTAISKALTGSVATKELKLNSKSRDRLSVGARVIARDVPKDFEIPEFD